VQSVVGTYENGQVNLDAPVEWEPGTRVRVVLEEASLGIREEDWPSTPEGIGDLLARMETLEPLELTPDEEAEIEAARADVRRVTLDAVRKQMGL
jgi:hypothetical protein